MGATAVREQHVVEQAPRSLLIGGEWREATGGASFAVEDPSTSRALCDVADATPADGFAALDAAAAAQDDWASFPPRERAEILQRVCDLMHQDCDDLALLVTLEMGKPLTEAAAEVRYAADMFRWFAAEAVRIDGGFGTAPNGAARLLVMRRPVGPCLLITPWNFPLAMGARKIGPAIAASCTMVVKPAPQTPLSMLALGRILLEVGLPRGVLNIVPTTDAGGVMEPLFTDGRARKVSFTGSTVVGRRLMAAASEQVLRISLELGGNAPFVVFADADIDAAVDGAMTAKMRNIGEACTAANRFYVHQDVSDEFTEQLAARMGALTVGRGTDPMSQVGPLIERRARDKVCHLVDDAVSRGAEIVTGGTPIDGPGHFYPPTVLTNVRSDSAMCETEIFGPVAPISTFRDEEDVLAAANDTPYGLAGYVYTNDLTRAMRVCERLDVGMIGLNQGVVSEPAAPFGGVKQSGIGREGGRVGIEEYLESKFVAIACR